LTFALRAIAMIDGPSRWGLSTLSTERYQYVRREVLGETLDVGCGPHNRVVDHYRCSPSFTGFSDSIAT
jgi:hypothetical protein